MARGKGGRLAGAMRAVSRFRKRAGKFASGLRASAGKKFSAGVKFARKNKGKLGLAAGALALGGGALAYARRRRRK